MVEDIRAVMWFVLVRLSNMRKWGGAHSELKRVLKSLPDSCKDKKLIKKAIKNLINLGYIGIYKKTGEEHVSLNPRKVKEINGFLDKFKEEMEKRKILFKQNDV